MSRHLRFTAALSAVVLFATPALAGVSVTGSHPSERTHEKFGLDLGARVAFSTPIGESKSFDHGIDAAVTLMSMQSRHVGIGAELGYLHWPSSEGGRAIDQELSVLSNQLGGPPIQGTQVFINAFQASAHMRWVPLSGRALVPWTDLGAGLERGTGTIDFPDTGPGSVFQLQDSHHVTYNPALSVSAGFDVSSQKGVRVGPDVSGRWAFVDGTTFSALGVGLHVVFEKP